MRAQYFKLFLATQPFEVYLPRMTNQKQIAEKLGVSISLVSRVLSGSAKKIGIAQATIDKVTITAREMGYVPNAAAQSLKGKSTRTIGVVVYDFKDPFFGTLVHHLQARAHEADHTLLLVGFQNREPNERDLSPLLKFPLDGIIAIGSDFTENWLSKFERLPCARIGHGHKNIKSLKVTSDEHDGYTQLSKHLNNEGVTTATFIGVDRTIQRQRCEIFKAATENIEISEYLSDDHTSRSFEIGQNITAELIKTGLPQALVCANDRIAMGAIHAASTAGLRVPEDVRIVGYDDIQAATQFRPPLTTIRQPIADIANNVIESILKKECPSETRLLPTELIIRATA